jgi:hypothetical protein
MTTQMQAPKIWPKVIPEPSPEQQTDDEAHTGTSRATGSERDSGS